MRGDNEKKTHATRSRNQGRKNEETLFMEVTSTRGSKC